MVGRPVGLFVMTDIAMTPDPRDETIAELEALVAELEARVAELERGLKLRRLLPHALARAMSETRAYHASVLTGRCGRGPW